jgi:hypothetical protein
MFVATTMSHTTIANAAPAIRPVALLTPLATAAATTATASALPSTTLTTATGKGKRPDEPTKAMEFNNSIAGIKRTAMTNARGLRPRVGSSASARPRRTAR